MKAKLSLCVVAGEEASRISRCLLSVSDLADEIIVVVDDKSKDDTTQIA
jgi:glycosyltransferase involved in cell wall biosynthesis